MGFKEIVKKEFLNSESITEHRYKSAKFLFVFLAFLFFTNFFFVGANFYASELMITLPYIYILLLLSIVFFLYFLCKKNFLGKVSPSFFYFLFFVFLILFLFLLLPLAFSGGVLYFFN